MAGSLERPLNQPLAISHGTLECFDIQASRRFYEEFLGLQAVRTSEVSMNIRVDSSVLIVVIQVGEQHEPNRVLHHYGLDLSSREAVDEAYETTHKEKDRYAIRNITQPRDQHGVYSFYLEDLDSNWWEFQYMYGPSYDEVYAQGDLTGAGVNDKSWGKS